MSPGLMIAMVLMVTALLLRLDLCVFSYLIEPHLLVNSQGILLLECQKDAPWRRHSSPKAAKSRSLAAARNRLLLAKEVGWVGEAGGIVDGVDGNWELGDGEELARVLSAAAM